VEHRNVPAIWSAEKLDLVHFRDMRQSEVDVVVENCLGVFMLKAIDETALSGL